MGRGGEKWQIAVGIVNSHRDHVSPITWYKPRGRTTVSLDEAARKRHIPPLRAGEC